MIFASKAFFLFLPIVLVLYHALNRRTHKYLVLTLASWAFYAFASPQYLWVILLLTLIDYVAGRMIDGARTERVRKTWLAVSIVSNLALLIAFKYTMFTYDNLTILGQELGFNVPSRAWKIILPLGISFHTFQGISYTVDVYRRQIPAVRSFVDYALFVAFFPQLAAGPIVRAVEFLPQMVTPPTVSAQQVSDGLWLFVAGLFKKLVIADSLDGLFVSPVFDHPANYDDATHRWAAVAWAVQIYCDFSGYTDMALGIAKWFGFELPGNFRLPYLATNIADFWRRWHISLSSWLRDYLYFPMGGSRGGPLRTYFNLMTLFVLCGLWHGAAWNWLAYGVFNGLLMALHRAYDRSLAGIPWADAVRASFGWKVFAWAGSTFQFLVGLVLIRMVDWNGGLLMIRSLAGVDHGAESSAAPAAFVPQIAGAPGLVVLLIGLGLMGHVLGLIQEWPWFRTVKVLEFVRSALAALAIAGILVFGPGVGKTFIYIQF